VANASTRQTPLEKVTPLKLTDAKIWIDCRAKPDRRIGRVRLLAARRTRRRRWTFQLVGPAEQVETLPRPR